MKDAIDFLDRIEGHGYGGMADYEIARTTVRDAAAEIERLTAMLSWIADVDPQIVDAARDKFARTPEQEAALQELVDQAQELDMGY